MARLYSQGGKRKTLSVTRLVSQKLTKIINNNVGYRL